MADAIEVANLIKIFKKSNNPTENTALDELNLKISEGSIFGLLGPNGAGKSTLINILAGTVIKTSGTVKIAGHNIDQTPKLARSQIGIVPQEVVLDSFFTLHQALEFAAGYYGIRPTHRKTNEILRALGLFDKKDALPRQLSGGMKRRFMIAKAMVHSPKILVLDEPTAGVDIELREQLWKYVRKINKEGATIIITTHYLAEAEELCDQIAFINYGRIIRQDSKQNLLAELSSRYIDVEFADNTVNLADLNFEKYELQGKNSLRVYYSSNTSSDLNQVLTKLNSLNLIVKNLSVNQPDLEDVFKRLIV